MIIRALSVCLGYAALTVITFYATMSVARVLEVEFWVALGLVAGFFGFAAAVSFYKARQQTDPNHSGLKLLGGAFFFGALSGLLWLSNLPEF